MNISIGKLRGLQQLADSKGMVTMVAIDQRGALKRALNEKNPAAVSYQEIVDLKLDLCQTIAPLAKNVPSDIRRGVVVLWSGSEPHYVDERVQTLRRMSENNAIEIREVCGQGLGNLARVASLLYLASSVSIYLALCNEFS